MTILPPCRLDLGQLLAIYSHLLYHFFSTIWPSLSHTIELDNFPFLQHLLTAGVRDFALFHEKSIPTYVLASFRTPVDQDRLTYLDLRYLQPLKAHLSYVLVRLPRGSKI